MLWPNKQASSSNHYRGTNKGPAHCDWMVFCLFTGCRIGEYGQTDNYAFSKYTMGPKGDSSSEFNSARLASCHADFLFFDFFSKKVPYMNKLDCLGFFGVRFR
jgi:hypothetical protein